VLISDAVDGVRAARAIRVDTQICWTRRLGEAMAVAPDVASADAVGFIAGNAALGHI
jgi:hypothetical protein